jgi:hypothetical protein
MAPTQPLVDQMSYLEVVMVYSLAFDICMSVGDSWNRKWKHDFADRAFYYLRNPWLGFFFSYSKIKRIYELELFFKGNELEIVIHILRQKKLFLPPYRLLTRHIKWPKYPSVVMSNLWLISTGRPCLKSRIRRWSVTSVSVNGLPRAKFNWPQVRSNYR